MSWETEIYMHFPFPSFIRNCVGDGGGDPAGYDDTGDIDAVAAGDALAAGDVGSAEHLPFLGEAIAR